MSQFQQEEQQIAETPVEDQAIVATEVEDAGDEPTTGSVSGGARIIVKRAGVETAEVFEFMPPAVIGRFDPSVGPVDIDLGNLPEGAYVSRKHARVDCEDGVWKITDLGSSNGTYVLKDDFEKVDESTLEDGTEFALGNARFVIHLNDIAG